MCGCERTPYDLAGTIGTGCGESVTAQPPRRSRRTLSDAHRSRTESGAEPCQDSRRALRGQPAPRAQQRWATPDRVIVQTLSPNHLPTATNMPTLRSSPVHGAGYPVSRPDPDRLAGERLRRWSERYADEEPLLPIPAWWPWPLQEVSHRDGDPDTAMVAVDLLPQHDRANPAETCPGRHRVAARLGTSTGRTGLITSAEATAGLTPRVCRACSASACCLAVRSRTNPVTTERPDRMKPVEALSSRSDGVSPPCFA